MIQERSSDYNFTLANYSNLMIFRLGMVQTLVLIYKEHGIFKGLYRGMSINYLRAMPMVAVSFSTYELMKQALKLDTGLKL